METAFYLYTLLIMVVCLVAGSVSLSAYFVSHRRSFLYAFSMLIFYFLDLALIFQYEYLGQNIAYSFESFYAIDHPALRILMGLGTLQSLWMVVCDHLNERRPLLIVAPAVVFTALSAIIIVALPETALRQWLFYTMRQVFMLWCLGYALLRYCTTTSRAEKARLHRHERLFVATTALVFMIVLEDVLMILVLDPDIIGNATLLPLYISERNFSENILIVMFSFVILRAASATLHLRFKEPPMPETPDLSAYIDDLLPAYSERYGLTARERELLRLILQGKNNQNIASELQLALGTVKAHVHNILKKTGHSTRQDLIQDFWKG
ncbi:MULTISPECIES: helix-turn-helix transcriptional regulator [unclassified Adlercreutzia]|uniref:helix-turn-helix transcriptional regulator n=1 Tax=unclassified Adlercreutzia TaxID=2636013 RepID=UPI0013ED7F5B|nr:MULTISPECIES: helix-turn-helix transcriptional regulator [unclassified Adlercreutzia]